MALEDIRRELRRFVDERQWNRYQTPKNLSMALTVEASELMEIFQWIEGEASRTLNAETLDRVRDEIADVMIYCLHIANELGIDPEEAIRSKLERNRIRFPATTARKTSIT